MKRRARASRCPGCWYGRWPPPKLPAIAENWSFFKDWYGPRLAGQKLKPKEKVGLQRQGVLGQVNRQPAVLNGSTHQNGLLDQPLGGQAVGGTAEIEPKNHGIDRGVTQKNVRLHQFCRLVCQRNKLDEVYNVVRFPVHHAAPDYGMMRGGANAARFRRAAKHHYFV